jgi:hypothetical protein
VTDASLARPIRTLHAMNLQLLAHVTEVESVSMAVVFAAGAIFGSLATLAVGFAAWRRKQ